MVTDEAYAQYQETQKDLERRQAEKKIQEEREAVLKNEKLSEEAKKSHSRGKCLSGSD